MSEIKIEIKARKLKALGDRISNVWLKRYVGKFKGAISKLYRAIDDDVYEINQQMEWGDKYQKYVKELNELNERNKSRNSEGQPLPERPLPPGQMRLTPEALKDPDAYFNARKKLDVEHSEAITEEEKRVNDFIKKMNENISVTVKHLIKTEDYLEEISQMNGEDYDLLSPFLDKDIEDFDISKIEEKENAKLKKDLENQKKIYSELKEENKKLEDRIVELVGKLAKTEKKD